MTYYICFLASLHSNISRVINVSILLGQAGTRASNEIIIRYSFYDFVLLPTRLKIDVYCNIKLNIFSAIQRCCFILRLAILLKTGCALFLLVLS